MPTMKRVLLSLPDDLLAALDHEAKAYYMTRSELMRRALIHYLQPAAPPRFIDDGRERVQDVVASNDKASQLYTDPEELINIVRR